MNHTIPGTLKVEGREFFYIEILSAEDFNQIIDAVLTGSPDVPLPKVGGVIEEKVRIILDGGTSLLGVSYKGDLEGWKQKLLSFCRTKNRRFGIISQQKLTLSDGTEFAIDQCHIVFDR